MDNTVQKAVVVYAHSPEVLNRWLEVGWKVVSLTPFPHTDSYHEPILVIISQEV